MRALRTALAEAGRVRSSARLLASVDRQAARLARIPAPLQALARSGAARWLGELLFDLDRGARLPRPPRRPFSGASDRPPVAGADPVLYYPGCQALWDAEGEGPAVMALLAAAGFAASAPELPCCGLPAHVQGLARGPELRGLGQGLAAASRDGRPIVYSAPSCEFMLRREAVRLQPDGPWAELAARSGDLFEALEPRRASIELLPAPKRVAYHHPCHARHLRTPELALRWLRRVPGVEVVQLPQACCGRGGTWGLKRQRRGLSLDIAAPLVDELRRAQVDLVVTPCGACRAQLSELSGVPGAHPAQVVAAALARHGADSG